MFDKRTELFDPLKFIKRELEKAKFCSYKVSNDYDAYRKHLNETLVSFDEKYFRRFDPINYSEMTLEQLLSANQNKNNKKISSVPDYLVTPY